MNVSSKPGILIDKQARLSLRSPLNAVEEWINWMAIWSSSRWVGYIFFLSFFFSISLKKRDRTYIIHTLSPYIRLASCSNEMYSSFWLGLNAYWLRQRIDGSVSEDPFVLIEDFIKSPLRKYVASIPLFASLRCFILTWQMHWNHFCCILCFSNIRIELNRSRKYSGTRFCAGTRPNRYNVQKTMVLNLKSINVAHATIKSQIY